MNPNAATSALMLIFTGGSSALALAQTVSAAPDYNMVGQIERLGLEGILILIVVILWRKLEAKEGREEKLLTAMLASTEALRAMTERLDRLDERVDHSFSVRETLEHRQRKPHGEQT